MLNRWISLNYKKAKIGAKEYKQSISRKDKI